jgi:hypothetical protein
MIFASQFATRQGAYLSPKFASGSCLAFGIYFYILSPLTYAATITASSCNTTNVNAAVNAASAGDIVQIPAGSCTWSSGITVNKPITVQGADKHSTKITWTGSAEAIRIAASGAIVKGFSVTSVGGNGSLLFVSAGADRWRVTDMTLDGGTSFGGLFINIPSMSNTGNTYGLIDSSSILNMRGEQAFFRGPCNSWQIPHSKGGAANLFIEDNTITAASGYSAYWDFNANARAVIRYNTVSNVYFDGHGTLSNSTVCSPETHRSYRHMEVYKNTWNSVSDWRIVYPRGGSGAIWGNRISVPVSKGQAMIMLDEYCARVNDPSGYCVKNCAPTSAVPLKDQIGRGIDLVASPVNGNGQQSPEPFLIWDNLYSDGTRIYVSPLDDTGFGNSCGTPALSNYIRQNVDYCLGTGTQATTKPSSCNGTAVTYAPYTYPHPIRGGAQPPAIDAPPNLRFN